MSSSAGIGRTGVSRWVSSGVLVLLVAASVAAFVSTRHVVDDQEQRLLKERTDEVSALLANSTVSVKSSLQLLGNVGSMTDPAALRQFQQSAAPLINPATVLVAIAAKDGATFRMIAAVGDTSSMGAPLPADRADLANRALHAGDLVTAVLRDESGTRLAFALAAMGETPAVIYQETRLDPATPIPPTPSSPYRELRVALYAADVPDPSKLVLTTERNVPLTGEVLRVPFAVGADHWLLAVGARGSLVGTFAQRTPWFLLAGGLVAALLATGIVDALTRRRAYALRLVGERTQQLDDARRFLQHLWAVAPLLVRRVTLPEREISYVSPNIEQLFGVTEEEALTPGYLGSTVHPQDRPAFDAALDRIEAGSPRESQEYRRERDGSYHWVSAVLVPETDDEGNVIAALGYLIDVDDRRRAEDAQRRAQEEADAANHSKSEFLSRMSHELRTPLNAVLGFGQLLALEPLTGDQRDSVDQILKGGRHLLDLINEVLDISRIETGDLALSPEAVLAAELVGETVDLIRPIADQREIQLVFDRSGVCDCHVFADRQRTKQVLLNLLSNAVKYNRPRGTVAISCARPDPSRVQISVADTGPGIASERLEQLFMPFERLGAEHTDVEGTGIGLALSQRLTTAMGGALSVVSEQGKGATFILELPRVEGPVDRYERLNGPTEVAAPTAARHKVLYIEDNLSNVKLVERVLAQRPQVELVAAMHGRLGLELAHDHQPLLVLLDLHLPDIDGDQVLQLLRDDPVTSSIPVVILSADATAGQVRRLLTAGAAAYLTKPIDVPDLLHILDEVLPED